MLGVHGEWARGPDQKNIKLPILSLFRNVPSLFQYAILIYEAPSVCMRKTPRGAPFLLRLFSTLPLYILATLYGHMALSPFSSRDAHRPPTFTPKPASSSLPEG